MRVSFNMILKKQVGLESASEKTMGSCLVGQERLLLGHRERLTSFVCFVISTRKSLIS